jgi:hypothetical protein
MLFFRIQADILSVLLRITNLHILLGLLSSYFPLHVLIDVHYAIAVDVGMLRHTGLLKERKGNRLSLFLENGEH